MDAFSKLSGKKKGRRSKRRLQEQGPEMELERADENSNTGGRNQVPVNTEEHVYRGAVAGNNPSASLNIDTYDPFMLAVERYNNSGHVRDWPVARASANNEQQIIRPAFPHARRGLSLLPRWEQDIIIRSQTTRECLFDFLATIPAILYTITALVPLIELPEIAIRHGFRIANGVMFCFLIVLGYWGERFKPENRWYPRHYFVWTGIFNLLMWLGGYYPDDFEETGRRIQAVQMLVFWFVELLVKGKLERLNKEEG